MSDSYWVHLTFNDQVRKQYLVVYFISSLYFMIADLNRIRTGKDVNDI